MDLVVKELLLHSINSSIYKFLSNLYMPKTLKIKSHKRKNKTRRRKEIIINSDFESGNIVHLSSTENNAVHLEIRGEKYEKKQTNKYRNWFYFKAKNVKQKTKFIIHDLKNFDDDWKGYTVCYSYDNKKWKRLPTKVDLKNLKMTWKINPKKKHYMVRVLCPISI